MLAERHALESTQNTVRYELRDAAARVDSARQSFTHHRPGPAGAGEAQPRGDAGRLRRRPGRRGRPAGRAAVVPAGADRARAGAGGAGVERGGSRTRRGNAGGARRQAMSALRTPTTPADAPGRPAAGRRGPAPRRGDDVDCSLGAGGDRRPRRRRFDRSATPAFTWAAARASSSSSRAAALHLPDAPVDRAGPPGRVSDLQHDAGAEAGNGKATVRAGDRHRRAGRRARPVAGRPHAGAHPAHRDEDGDRQTRGARRRAAHRAASSPRTSAGWRRSPPASRAGSRSCWCPRRASASGAARRWPPSTAPTCCAPSRSCWSRAGWNAGADGTPTHADAHARRRASPPAWIANSRRRLELLGISAQEIDEVLRTGKAVEAIAIRSPAEGYVVGKNAVAGVAVQPGTVLFEVADLLPGLGDRGDLRAGHLAHPRRPDARAWSCRRSPARATPGR